MCAEDLTKFDLPIHVYDNPFVGVGGSVKMVSSDALYKGSFVHKRWGSEEIIVNNRMYCGKILTILPGEKTSYHYHAKKNETFYVLSGRAVVYIGDEEKLTRVLDMLPGDSALVKNFEVHSIASPDHGIPLRLLEISTTDSENDSYRVKFPLQ